MRILKITAFLSLLGLASCASMFEASTQRVRILTPGVVGADCRLENDDYAFQIYTPDVVTLERSYMPLTAVCQADGYETRIAEIPVHVNRETYLNAFNGVLPGTLYDAGARTLPEYPDPIIIEMMPILVEEETVIPVYEPADIIPAPVPYQADVQAERVLRGNKPK